MPVRSYRDLVAWQNAMDLVVETYEVTRSWPKADGYGLTSQIRWAAVSVPSNIAEGQARSSTKEFLNHLSISRGSLVELETQAMLAERLGYLSAIQAQHLLEAASEIGRLLNGLTRSLSPKVAAGH